MAYTETAKEKEKREAYYKANKERGIRAEKQKEYEMFGTTEQNIPKVDTMGNVTGMKKGGKVMSKKGKCYDEGGEIEFETKQGQNAAIKDDTRARAMAALESGKMDQEVEAPKAKAKPSFAAKAKKAGFTSAETGGGAALMTRKMAKGGKVKSASARADGIAIRGKTRA